MGSPSTTDSIIEATKKAVDHPDLQTIFFVNLIPGNLNPRGTEEVQRTVSLISSWQAWTSAICEGNIKQQIDKKELSDTDDGQYARALYRSKVFRYIFGHSTWFAKTFEQDMTKHIEVPKVDFHSAILMAVLEGFNVPAAAFDSLEKILTTIGDNITASRSKTKEEQQYWIMFVRYDWQDVIETVQPVIRNISFSIDEKMSDYLAGKPQLTSISTDLKFNQAHADFDIDIYEGIRESIDQNLIDAGQELVKQKTTSVSL